MVQCEMCGAETPDANRVKIEGAELDVCDSCTDFGTEVQTEDSSSTSTKYSTSGSSSTESSSTGTGTGTSTGGGRRGDEMYDDIDELAQDYDDRIRSAREKAGLSQDDLAKQLNEKASLIGKLEHGDVLPSDDVQRKLERALDIDLTVSGAGGDDEWSGGSSTGEYTLGDMVERN